MVSGGRRGGREVRRGAQDGAVSGGGGGGGGGERGLGQGGGVFDCSDEEVEIQSHGINDFVFGFWEGSEKRRSKCHWCV